MNQIIILLLLLSSVLLGEDTLVQFSKYSVVDAIYKSELTKEGEKQVIKRYVVKDMTIVEIGKRSFLSGKTPAESNVVVDGSNYSKLFIPVDLVVAIGGLENLPELVQKGGILNTALGAEVK
jgi:hypothetical protein